MQNFILPSQFYLNNFERGKKMKNPYHKIRKILLNQFCHLRYLPTYSLIKIAVMFPFKIYSGGFLKK